MCVCVCWRAGGWVASVVCVGDSPFRGQGQQRMMCVSMCVHAPVSAFLTPALFGPLLISDLWSDIKLKN